MKAAFLDWDSLNGKELTRDSLLRLPVDWTFYDGIDAVTLRSQISDYDLVVSNKVILSAEVMQSASRLKLICIAATGTNNVDLVAAQRQGVRVCNVRAYATESVVQHVFMLMLNLARQFMPYQHELRQGAWQQSKYFCLLNHPIQSLTGKTLGIIGYGELGQAVASMAKQFGMHVLVAQSVYPGANSIDGEGRVTFDELLARADFVSLHCPLSEQTRNLIDKRALLRMKSTAFLINTARGGIVMESDLLEALQQGTIAGAALDVLHQEPPVNGNLLLDARLPNLILTPHIAWAAREARQTLVDKIAQNIECWLDGAICNEVLP